MVVTNYLPLNDEFVNKSSKMNVSYYQWNKRFNNYLSFFNFDWFRSISRTGQWKGHIFYHFSTILKMFSDSFDKFIPCNSAPSQFFSFSIETFLSTVFSILEVKYFKNNNSISFTNLVTNSQWVFFILK